MGRVGGGGHSSGWVGGVGEQPPHTTMSFLCRHLQDFFRLILWCQKRSKFYLKTFGERFSSSPARKTIQLQTPQKSVLRRGGVPTFMKPLHKRGRVVDSPANAYATGFPSKAGSDSKFSVEFFSAEIGFEETRPNFLSLSGTQRWVSWAPATPFRKLASVQGGLRVSRPAPGT